MPTSPSLPGTERRMGLSMGFDAEYPFARNMLSEISKIGSVCLHADEKYEDQEGGDKWRLRSNRCSLLRSKIYRLDREHATGGDDAKARRFYYDGNYTEGTSPPSVAQEMVGVGDDYDEVCEILERTGYKGALLEWEAQQAAEKASLAAEWEEHTQRQAATEEQTQQAQSQG